MSKNVYVQYIYMDIVLLLFKGYPHFPTLLTILQPGYYPRFHILIAQLSLFHIYYLNGGLM